VLGPGVYCAAEHCGVWYQPPDNCLTESDQCWYYDPDDLREEAYTGPGGGGPDGNYFPACDKTINCQWDPDYAQCDPTGSNTTCLWCYNAQTACTCTDVYGNELPCCYYCADGSGCGNDGGGGGSSPTPTPSGCVPGLPSSPTLTSPDDGAVLTETTVELSWQPPSEWNDCDGTHEDLAPLSRPVGSRGGALLRPGTHTEPRRAQWGGIGQGTPHPYKKIGENRCKSVDLSASICPHLRPSAFSLTRALKSPAPSPRNS